MIPSIQQEILHKIACLCEVSPDVRFGQLLAHLGFLGEDSSGQSLWDIEDEAFLQVVEGHLTEMTRRMSSDRSL